MLDMALACSTSCFLWVLALVALQCGIPQGFILGPIFFSINMYLFGEISAHNKILVSARDIMLNETKMMSTLVLFSLGLTISCPRWLMLRTLLHILLIFCSAQNLELCSAAGFCSGVWMQTSIRKTNKHPMKNSNLGDYRAELRLQWLFCCLFATVMWNTVHNYHICKAIS